MKKTLSFIVVLFTVISVILSCPTVSAQAKFELNAHSTTKSVTLKWNKVKGAKYYKIYRKTANTKYIIVCRNTAELKFTDKNLKSGKKYIYKVKAYKKDKTGKFLGFATVSKAVTTKKPTDYKNVKSYLNSLTNDEKTNLIQKDIKYYKIPKGAKLINFKKDLYDKIDGKYFYGYYAKFQLNKKAYTALYKEMYDKDRLLEFNEFYIKNVSKKIKWWNLTQDNVTATNYTFRSGKIRENWYIKTVITWCYTAKINGKYYLFVDCTFTTANEYFV